MNELETFFTDAISLVNKELDRLIPQKGVAPQTLRDAVRWSLFAGGKRFRPALVLAVARTFGVDDGKVLGTAAAVEMIHTYSLIHDDLPSMDDDDLRRGRETCHVKFGEATAILAGDALQALAFHSIAADRQLKDAVKIELISGLGKAAACMVIGQHLDLEAEGKELSIGDIETIHANKTGALILFSARAAAVIAGVSAAERGIIETYAAKLGLLFQITDDLLDVTHTTDRLGKTAGKDFAAYKATYPSILGIDKAKDLAISVHAEALAELERLDAPSDLLKDVSGYILTRGS
ncbi:(2E,6E)-farnesyl diphosphate synthase [soil metagenome]